MALESRLVAIRLENEQLEAEELEAVEEVVTAKKEKAECYPPIQFLLHHRENFFFYL